MTLHQVTNQAELDAALAASEADPHNIHTIDIRSEAGVELMLADNKRARINVRGQSRVQRVGRVGGSARVDWVGDSASVGEVVGSASVGRVGGSASVGWVGDSASVGRVVGSARVGRVGDSASVGEVVGSASVGRVGGSASVGEVGGSASVDWVGDSARVDWVGGSARVDWVGDSARVDWVGDSASVGRVGGSARVGRVGDSASVGRATETAAIHLHDQATLERAGSHVAVFLHSQRATFSGGHLIDLTQLDQTDTSQWADHHGCDTDGDHLIAYKAVRDDWRSARSTVYRPGTTASCDDFIDVDECGGGLHFSPTPRQAKDYDPQATRYVELRVPLAAVRTITGGGTPKAKAQSVECVREVDIHARPVEVAATGETGGAS